MRYTIKGKNLEIGEKTKEKISDKLDRIKRLFSEDAEAILVIQKEKLEYRIEATIPMAKRLLRAEHADTDMMAAMDKIVDIMEKQIVKYKKRLQSQVRKSPHFQEELDSVLLADVSDEEEEYKIVKNKRFELRPMDAYEAVMQMDLLGHSFFVFRNGETDIINVVYKRKDGSYGLIEPEY